MLSSNYNLIYEYGFQIQNPNDPNKKQNRNNNNNNKTSIKFSLRCIQNSFHFLTIATIKHYQIDYIR